MSPAREPAKRSAPGIVTLGHRDLLTMREILAESEAAAAFIRQVLWTPFIPDTHKVYQLNDRGRPLDGKDGRDLVIDEANTIATATAAAMTGRELGLDFFTSLRSIYILNGQPSLYVKAARGLVQAAGHHVVVVKTTKFEARVRVKRHNEDDWQESLWDEQRAKDAGLLPGRGDKSPWRLNPKAMLVARATGEGCNWIGGDVLLGIPLYEELYDRDTEEAFTGTLAITAGPSPDASTEEGGKDEGGGQRTVSRPRRPRAAARPANEGTVTDTGPANPGGQPGQTPAARDEASERPMNDRERKAVMAQLRKLGYDLDDPARRKDAYNLIGGWLERPVTSTKGFTGKDARTVLERIKPLIAMGAQAEGGEDHGPPDDVPPPDEEPR